MNHDILAKKLYLYGARNMELKWFKSYLSNRQQLCKVNGISSNLQDIECGVPHGSCIGPLIFLLFINDMPLPLHHSKPINDQFFENALYGASLNSFHILLLCLGLMGVTTRKTLGKLQKLQNRGIRIIANSAYDVSVGILLRQLRLPSISNIIKQESAKHGL